VEGVVRCVVMVAGTHLSRAAAPARLGDFSEPTPSL
jgi:hypothetical protein